jgi:hypothetical protein
MCKKECAEIFKRINSDEKSLMMSLKSFSTFQSEGSFKKITLSKKVHYENMSHHYMSFAILIYLFFLKFPLVKK